MDYHNNYRANRVMFIAGRVSFIWAQNKFMNSVCAQAQNGFCAERQYTCFRRTILWYVQRYGMSMSKIETRYKTLDSFNEVVSKRKIYSLFPDIDEFALSEFDI